MQNLFVYGTLLSSEITEKLTGKTFKTTHAVLDGYKMYCVKDCDYPAILLEQGAEVKGKILLNVDDSALKILSEYEGNEYEKRMVKVMCSNKVEDTLTFVWVKEKDRLENKKWNFAEFQNKKLGYYMKVIISDTLDECQKY